MAVEVHIEPLIMPFTAALQIDRADGKYLRIYQNIFRQGQIELRKRLLRVGGQKSSADLSEAAFRSRLAVYQNCAEASVQKPRKRCPRRPAAYYRNIKIRHNIAPSAFLPLASKILAFNRVTIPSSGFRPGSPMCSTAPPSALRELFRAF